MFHAGSLSRVGGPMRRVVCGLVLLVASRESAIGQGNGSRPFFSIAGGVAAQPPLPGVRSVLGGALDVAVGKFVATHHGFEARVGTQFFPRGDARITPAGCLDVIPCHLPLPSAVRIVTLAGEYVRAVAANGAGPIFIAGLGYRYTNESPEAASEARPFAEVGAGLARSFGTKTIGLEGRLQFAVASADVPRWTVPIGINVRFF